MATTRARAAAKGEPAPPVEATPWARLLLGLAVVYALFQWSATSLGSDRGQAGVVVAALVVGATLAVERLLFGVPLARAARELGLGRPRARGLATAAVISALLLLVFPAFSLATGRALHVDPGWPALAPGLFAQAGIAEETLFRGYLFRRVRRGRSFRRAAVVASIPFVLVHLTMFATMDFPVAAAGLLLSVVISFPLAWLFELGGDTVWAPALLHFVVQGAIKVVSAAPADALLPVTWMTASAVLPWLAFAVRRPAR